MRKSNGLTSVLVKINERYNVLKTAYNQRMDELLEMASKLNSNTGEESVKLAVLLQQKIYSCSEIIIQFQSWLDDIQSLEIVDGLEKKLKILYAHTRNEFSTLEEFQILVKDYLKTQISDTPLIKDVQQTLKNMIKLLTDSKHYTNKQIEDVYSMLFNKRKLIDSLSEHI
ncbi:MAG: hypothetical protein QW327_00080 [Candidatus Odinarchaeota archaeon]